MGAFRTIDRDGLARRLERQRPDNGDRSQGYALVNVLGEEQFQQEHIPGSSNIPQGQEEAFEKRYAKDKEIVVYCASSECDASEKAAEELARRGFQRVVDYSAGLSDWRSAGGRVVGQETS